MRSHLLHGVVRHRRARPFVYGLQHGVFYAALDLDELDDVDRSLRLFRRNRPGPGRLPRRRSPRPAGGRPSDGVHRSPARPGRGPARLADHARHQPARRRLRLQSGQLLPLPRCRTASCGSSWSRSTTPTASATCTRSARATRTPRPSSPRWTRRSTSRRSSRCAAATTVRVRDEPTRLRITINQHQPDGLELHTSLDLDATAPDRPEPASAGAAPPVPARSGRRRSSTGTPCGCGCAAPASIDTARPPDDQPDPVRRPFRRAGLAGSPRLAGRAGGRRADPRRAPRVVLPGRRRSGRSATTLPAASPRSGSTTARRWSASSSAARPGPARRYMDGLWSSPDLPALLRLAARNRESLALSGGWFRVPAQLGRTIAHRARRNTRAGSRRNIAAHYDLGNDFYRLFLDEIDDLLERGVRHGRPVAGRRAARTSTGGVAANAGLRAGQHVLEIGTGWGGFALYAAGELGCRVTTITISQEQYELARERVRDAGLDAPRRRPAARLPRHRGHVRRDRLDRDARGRRRRVPRDVLRGLRSGAATGRPAEPPGRSPSRMPPTSGSSAAPTGSRRTSSRAACARRWPSSSGRRATRASSITQRDRYRRRLRPDAARVADRRSSDRLDDVRALGFDDRFIRMWEYYLALSEAGFATGISQDLQIVMEKARGIGPAPGHRSGSAAT